MVGDNSGAAQMSKGVGSNLGSIFTAEDFEIGFAVYWRRLGAEVALDCWPRPGEAVYATFPADQTSRRTGDIIAISADLATDSSLPIGTFRLDGRRLEMKLHRVPRARDMRVFAEV